MREVGLAGMQRGRKKDKGNGGTREEGWGRGRQQSRDNSKMGKCIELFQREGDTQES